LAYYLAISLGGDRPGVDLRRSAAAWTAVALVAGPVFGGAGAVWRAGPLAVRPLAVALIAGALAAVGAYVIFESLRYGEVSDIRLLAGLTHLFGALLAPVFMLNDRQSRLWSYAFTVVFGAISLIALEFVLDLVSDALKPPGA
jgi:glucose uptake protein GlcU